MAQYFYIGPWLWLDDEAHSVGWYPPEGTVGCIDLRDYEACGLRDIVRGVGLFATDRVLKAPYVLLATDLDGQLDSVPRSALEQTLGVRLSIGSLRNTLVELFTQQADPDQGRMTAPLGVKRDGTQEIWLAGERIWSKPFEGESDPAWPMVQAKYQRAYRAVREGALAAKSDVHLRYLSTLAAKCKVDPRLLVPDDLLYEGVLTPHTVLTESFNKENSSTLGPDQTWTEYVSGSKDLTVVSNALNMPYSGLGGGFARGRAEEDLSSADHYAQLNCTAVWTTNYHLSEWGTAVRYSTSADTCYGGWMGGNGANPTVKGCRTKKVVAGVSTNLGTFLADAWSVPCLLKFQVDGDVLTLYLAGVSKIQLTDTSITTGTRAGVHGWLDAYRGPHAGDDWEAGDLAAPPTTTTTTPQPPTTSTTTPEPPPTSTTTTEGPPTTSTTTPEPPPTSTTTTEGPPTTSTTTPVPPSTSTTTPKPPPTSTTTTEGPPTTSTTTPPPPTTSTTTPAPPPTSTTTTEGPPTTSTTTPAPPTSSTTTPEAPTTSTTTPKPPTTSSTTLAPGTTTTPAPGTSTTTEMFRLPGPTISGRKVPPEVSGSFGAPTIRGRLRGPSITGRMP